MGGRGEIEKVDIKTPLRGEGENVKTPLLLNDTLLYNIY
jgi:hypothetical protein